MLEASDVSLSSRPKQFSEKSLDDFLLATWQAIRLPLPMALTIVTCSTKKWSLISLKMEFLSYFPFDSHDFSVSSHFLCFERWGSFSLSLKFNPSTLRVIAYGEWGQNSCESFPLTLPITSPIPASFLPHFLLLSFHLSLIFLPCFLLFILFYLFLYSIS